MEQLLKLEANLKQEKYQVDCLNEEVFINNTYYRLRFGLVNTISTFSLTV